MCNTIGADLGLDPVIVRNRKNKRDPICSRWPHNVRPDSHYTVGTGAE
jgi:hypothetical protein